MNKIIFLDIDGILNSVEWYQEIDQKYKCSGWSIGLLNQEMILRLREIVNKSAAKIVLCSSWRQSAYMMSAIQNQFALYDLHIYGTTHTQPVARSKQILDWLRLNPTDEYVVLDDDPYDYPDPKVLKHLVQPSTQYGLQDEHVAAALRILGVEEANYEK